MRARVPPTRHLRLVGDCNKESTLIQRDATHVRGRFSSLPFNINILL